MLNRTVLFCLSIVFTLGGVAQAADIRRVGPDERIEITAQSMYDLGRSFVTVQAEDNFCNLAQWMAMAAGESANYVDGRATNVVADLMERARRPERARLLTAGEGPSHHQDELDFIKGYTDGYNAYAEQKEVLKSKHAACADGPISRFRLKVEHLAHSHGFQSCTANFDQAVIAATPPGTGRKAGVEINPHGRKASATWAFGDEIVEGAKSILMGNPHDATAPQFGVRLSVPEKIDIFAAAYSNWPALYSWTNGKVASAMTCHYGQPYAVYRLDLTPGDHKSYTVDGVVKRLEERPVSIKMRDLDGKVTTKRHTVYRSEFGFIIGGEDFPWDSEHAFAVREVNESVPDYFLFALNPRIYRAQSAEELVKAYNELERNDTLQLGIADDSGMAGSVPNGLVINLDEDQWADCAVFPERGAPDDIDRLPILDGARSACALKQAADTKTAGALSLARVPYHLNRRALMNSNQTASRTNPDKRLIGYPSFIDGHFEQPDDTLRDSGRFLAHRRLLRMRENGADGYPGDKWSVETTWARLLDSEGNWAARFKDDVVKICKAAKRSLQNGVYVDLQEACRVLDAWDGRARSESRGYLFWSWFWRELPADEDAAPAIRGARATVKDIFVDAFDPKRPYETPSAIDPKKAAIIVAALGRTARAFIDQGVAFDVSVGEGQVVVRDGRSWSLPGCQSWDACENVQLGPVAGPMRRYGRGSFWIDGVEGYVGGNIAIVYGLMGEGRVRIKYGGPFWSGDMHPTSKARTIGAERWSKGEGFDLELRFAK